MKCCGFAVKFQDRITFVFIYDFFLKGWAFKARLGFQMRFSGPGYCLNIGLGFQACVWVSQERLGFQSTFSKRGLQFQNRVSSPCYGFKTRLGCEMMASRQCLGFKWGLEDRVTVSNQGSMTVFTFQAYVKVLKNICDVKVWFQEAFTVSREVLL